MALNTNQWNRVRYTLFAPFYDRIASFRKQRRRSIELLELRSGERVLISGAGTGIDLEYIPPGVEISAVDITPAMVQRTRERGDRLGIPVNAILGDAQRLEYPDGSFDAVVLHLIVAVAPDGHRVLAEAARVLRNGGRIAVFDKFVPDTERPSVARQLLNVATSALFSDVTRQLGPMLEGTALEVMRREPAGLGGRFEIAWLRKVGV